MADTRGAGPYNAAHLEEAMEETRCPWVPAGDPLYASYHDDEWGVPLHDDRALFELLLLEGFQAGLSWRTILHKREGFRRAFSGFDPAAMARWNARSIERLVADPGIVRHRGKIEAARINARAYLALREAGRTLDAVVWDVVDGRPKINHFQTLAEVPAKTREAERLSKTLLKLGFKFVGPTTCYAFMQAAGLVDDHLLSCFRRAGTVSP